MTSAALLLALLSIASASAVLGQAPAAPKLTQQVQQNQPIYQTNPPIPPLPTKPDRKANFDAEVAQADALFVAGKRLDALPLYDDLSRQDPTVPLFAERHALALYAEWTAGMKDQNAALSVFLQMINELHRAQRLGDNSQQVRSTLSIAEKTPVGAIMTGIPLTVGYTYMGSPAVQAALGKAEARGNSPEESIRLHVAAAAIDPAFYNAALFTGDAYLGVKDYANAGVWYAKAIAIDPDRDTAYRYWGDALLRASDVSGAKVKLVQGFIAEPYSLLTWDWLRQWASVAKSPIVVPQIRRPQFYLLDGKADVDPSAMPETGDGHASWLVYQRVRRAHGAPSLVQVVPPAGGTSANGELSATSYIHTLAEETEALKALTADVRAKLAAGTVTPEKLEPGLKTLMEIEKDGMLECWVMLNASDMGLRHDYPAYRKDHRELMARYIDKYLLPAAI